MSPSVYLSSPIFITGMNASASIDRTASIVLDIFSLALYSRSNSSMHSNLVVLSPKSANGVDFFFAKRNHARSMYNYRCNHFRRK